MHDPEQNWMYTYKCKLVDNYDGDSVTLNIDLGLHTWRLREKARLYSVDTPELRGDLKEFGIFVRDELENFIAEHTSSGYELLAETHRDRSGKYGRLLVTLHLVNEEEELGINVNSWLIENKYAVSYFGESKDAIQAKHDENWTHVSQVIVKRANAMDSTYKSQPRRSS